MKRDNFKIEKFANYDAKSDVLYFGLKQGEEEEFVEIVPGVNVELDKKGKVIGVEIFDASRFLKMTMAGKNQELAGLAFGD